MRSFAMLESLPVDGYPGQRRFYIDGERVAFREFYLLDIHAKRTDSFRSSREGNRWHFRKVCHL